MRCINIKDMHEMIGMMQRVRKKKVTNISKVHINIIEEKWQAIVIVLMDRYIKIIKRFKSNFFLEQFINTVLDLSDNWLWESFSSAAEMSSLVWSASSSSA